MRSYILLIASAASFGAASASAAAAEVVITTASGPSATVSVDGLNLGSSRGIATGKARIEAAATDLCLTNAVEPVDVRLARAKCYRTAVLDGYQQLQRMAATGSAAPINATTALLTSIKR